jgi:predicted DNA binding protein
VSLTAEFRLSAPSLPLSGVAEAVPGTGLTIEEMRPNGGGPVLFLRVEGDYEGFEAAVERAPDATATAVVTEGDAGRLYQVLVADDPDVDLDPIALSKAVFENATVTTDGWHVRAVFSDRDELVAVREFCRENDIAFRLLRLSRTGGEAGRELTDPQEEALATAHEMGYFEIPRGASMTDVADALGISPASLSERFRRAQARLVERHVRPHIKDRTD